MKLALFICILISIDAHATDTVLRENNINDIEVRAVQKLLGLKTEAEINYIGPAIDGCDSKNLPTAKRV